jgi:alkylhydroperoxidase family enzyme
VVRVLAVGPRALPPKERALLEFVDQVNGAPAEIRKEDVEAAKSAGWSEEALYDAITVCSLFNFYNRWCDGAGVHAMAPEVHRASAKHTAARGYTLEL